MKYLLLILFINLSIQSNWSGPLDRKIEKEIKRCFNDANIIYEPIIHDVVHSRPGPGLKIYSLLNDENLLGYLVLTSAKGRYDYFDYCVIYKPDIEILRIAILTYRSDYGYEISNKSWLKQFYGSSGCSLEYGQDIDAISGATLSASSLTKDLEFLCELMISLTD